MKKLTPMLMLLLVLGPRFGVAQSSQNDWDNLKELRPGQRIQVVDVHMKTLNGAFVSFSDEAMTLRVGKGEVSVPRTDVTRVSLRAHRTRNMLLGSGILGGAALAVGIPLAVINSNEGNSCGACVAGIAAGFGGGAALGALPGNRTIYRANAVPGRAGAGPRGNN